MITVTPLSSDVELYSWDKNGGGHAEIKQPTALFSNAAGPFD